VEPLCDLRVHLLRRSCSSVALLLRRSSSVARPRGRSSPVVLLRRRSSSIALGSTGPRGSRIALWGSPLWGSSWVALLRRSPWVALLRSPRRSSRIALLRSPRSTRRSPRSPRVGLGRGSRPGSPWVASSRVARHLNTSYYHLELPLLSSPLPSQYFVAASDCPQLV